MCGARRRERAVEVARVFDFGFFINYELRFTVLWGFLDCVCIFLVSVGSDMWVVVDMCMGK